MGDLDDTPGFSLGLEEWVNVIRRGALFQLPSDLGGLSLQTSHLADLRNSQNLEVEGKGLLQEQRSSPSTPTPLGLDIHELSIPVSTNLQNQTSAVWTGEKIQARVYTPKPRKSRLGPYPLVVYFRGIGGWVIGDLETEDETCRQIASLSQSVVVNVGYRKAPMFKYPTPLQDCWDAMKWIAENAASHLQADLRTRGFIVGGTSSGALLATAIAIQSRDKGLSPPLTGQILRCPLTIHPGAISRLPDGLPSLTTKVNYPVLSRELHEQFFALYDVPPEHWTSPLVSPLLSRDLSALPPAYIQICDLDPTRDEALRYELRLADSGVRTKSNVYAGMPHSFWTLPRIRGAADATRDLVLGIKWLEDMNGWDSGVREELEEWIKDASETEGEQIWRERKLCRLDGCGCFM
ncbi:hypothetical protein FGG08_004087 [Glutinoglossum americanum]|uniref:Alpha/beta hydrolase fold-3 domain-containing protein n=1 Tax=Glutinoglossum americanum TaxID=1670608 RepID=A0A9P8KXH1_9PEZI|nr:hypothetical protein FGG08_004087 [Glutinoglossum americanum]